MNEVPFSDSHRENLCDFIAKFSAADDELPEDRAAAVLLLRRRDNGKYFKRNKETGVASRTDAAGTPRPIEPTMVGEFDSANELENWLGEMTKLIVQNAKRREKAPPG